MNCNSEGKEALVKIQHEWAQARLKGDSSFPRRIEADDFTVVWFDGRIVNKEEPDVAFAHFNIDNLDVRFYGETEIVIGKGSIKARTKTQDVSGKYVWTDTFLKQNRRWKAVASQVTPVFEK